MATDIKQLVNGARSVVTKVAAVTPAAQTQKPKVAGTQDVLRSGVGSIVDTFSNYSRNVNGRGLGAVTAGLAGKALGQAAPGMLLGASAGLAGSLTSEEQRKHKLRNILMGALAGGGATAGAGMLHSQYAATPTSPPQ